MKVRVLLTSAIALLLGFGSAIAQEVVATDSITERVATTTTPEEEVWRTIRATEGYEDYPDDALLPITREQAEILITKLILEARKPYVEAAYRDSVLLRHKVETLKRRALDEALARSYTAPYEERLAQMERLLYAILLSKGDIDPTIIKQLLPGVLPTSQGYAAPGMGSALQPQGEASHKATTECTSKCTHAKKESAKRDLTPDQAIALKPGIDEKQIELFMSVAYFAFDSSAIDTETTKTLDNVVAWMKGNDLRVSLRGYASPEGRMSYNNKLSARRVNAVADYLTKKGIPATRLEVIPSGIDSMKDTKSKYPQGRRVEIRPILY